MKKCSKCGLEKSHSCTYRYRDTKDLIEISEEKAIEIIKLQDEISEINKIIDRKMVELKNERNK